MNEWLAAILDATELPAQDKEIVRAETQIAAALADDTIGHAKVGDEKMERWEFFYFICWWYFQPTKRVVIVLRSKEDIERDVWWDLFEKSQLVSFSFSSSRDTKLIANTEVELRSGRWRRRRHKQQDST